jgi:hypothetical protein
MTDVAQQTVTKDVVVTAKVPVEGKQGAETKAYTLKEGVGDHYTNGELVEPGSTVLLTDAQYKAFGDKFEPVDKPSRKNDDDDKDKDKGKK